ncbi:hypothetical protein GQR58_025798 [Nymphon striatum]|nr:hypothetical protein GQR58_025798 [Nymphon striatum]
MMLIRIGTATLMLTLLAFQVSSAELLGLDDLNIPEGIELDLTDGKKIEELIQTQIPLIKSIMANGDPENSIPSLDPYFQDEKLPNVFNVDLSFAKAKVNIDGAKVTGMSNFELKELTVNTKDESISLSLEIPKLSITGNYKVDGTFQLDGPVKMDGAGPFQATLIRPTAEVYLSVKYENGTGLTVSGTSVSVDYEDVNLHLEGFMTGHPLSRIILFGIKRRAREYFEESKDEMEKKLGEFMSSTLNSIFDAIFTNDTEDAEEPEDSKEPENHAIEKRQACGSGNMNSYIDQVLINARPLIKQKADPIALKNLKKVVKLYDGKVTGLSSITRTGNVILKCTSSNINLSVNFGFGRVSAGYRWKKRVIFVKLKGRAEISFKSLGVSASISQARTSGAHPVITDLDLKLKGVKVHISGLSLAGHIIAAIISLISNIFRKVLANAIEGPIRKALQKQLDRIKISKLSTAGNYKVNGFFQLDGPVKMDGSGPFQATLIRLDKTLIRKMTVEKLRKARPN